MTVGFAADEITALSTDGVSGFSAQQLNSVPPYAYYGMYLTSNNNNNTNNTNNTNTNTNILWLQ